MRCQLLQLSQDMSKSEKSVAPQYKAFSLPSAFNSATSLIPVIFSIDLASTETSRKLLLFLTTCSTGTEKEGPQAFFAGKEYTNSSGLPCAGTMRLLSMDCHPAGKGEEKLRLAITVSARLHAFVNK